MERRLKGIKRIISLLLYIKDNDIVTFDTDKLGLIFDCSYKTIERDLKVLEELELLDRPKNSLKMFIARHNKVRKMIVHNKETKSFLNDVFKEVARLRH